MNSQPTRHAQRHPFSIHKDTRGYNLDAIYSPNDCYT